VEVNRKRLVAVFKALGDENRIKILELLMTGEKCACKLLDELNISQPTLSHHMKLLCDAEIVNCRKEGKWSYYLISEIGRDYAVEFLNSLSSVNTEKESCC
jgi:ArsR family transcriptional regulator